MNKDIWISFIIPAYNAENNLKECVQSIVYNNIYEKYINKIEIIIIENGSIDNTLNLAHEISQHDYRVRVYNSEKGVSKARNLGLVKAKGNYIVFVDSDDKLNKNSINLMIENLKLDLADLWVYGHIAGNNVKSVTDGKKQQIYVDNNIQEGKKKMIENPTRYMQVWGKMFRKTIIEKYGIKFNEKMKLSEDSDFTLKYLSKCKKIIFMPDIIYNYSLNLESTMRKYDGSKVKQYIIAMDETNEYVKNDKNIDKTSFEKYVLMHLNIAMVREVFVKENKKSIRDKIYSMTNLISNPIFYESIQHTKIKECNSLRMLPILLIKLHMKYIAAIIYSIRANLNAAKEGGLG